MERGNATLRAKALLAIAALIRRDARWLLALCSSTPKALPLLDRVTKEKDPYVRKCLSCLQTCVAATIPDIHVRVLGDVQRRKALHRANKAAMVTRELREELVCMRETHADDAAYARRETAQTVDAIRGRFQDEVKVLRTRAEAEARALRKEASDAVETATGLRTRLRACQEELAGRSQTGAKK